MGVIVVASLSFAAPSFAAAPGCGFLGLQPCPTQPPPPPPPATDDGPLPISNNPYDLQPFEPPVAGQPLYPRPNGHLYFGLTDYALSEGTANVDEIGGIMEALGGSFVRLTLYWPGVETAKDRYDWGRYDSQYRYFVKHGIRPMWTILYTPKFAAAPGTHCTGPNEIYCDVEAAGTPEAQAELTQFGHDLAERYPLAAGFEYRNEPDLDSYRKCSTDASWVARPEIYARNLVAFADGVHSGNTSARVLGGALSSCESGIRFTAYLDRMLAAGAADGMDALSWHPYDETPYGTAFAKNFQAVADTLRAHGVEDMRLVAGESGFHGIESLQSSRMSAQFGRVDSLDSSLALVDQYDMFAGFVDVEMNDADIRAYGWVKRKRRNKFDAKAVYCEFRNKLGFQRPLPSYMRGCLT